MAFRLESPSFKNAEMIPAKFTCDGEDVSPALGWAETPAGTKCLALICDDPDAPGRTFSHWILFNIPLNPPELREGIPTTKTLPNSARQGTTDFGKTGYGGPCPPGGLHRYFFKLYALDRMLDLAAGAAKNQLEKPMSGHILGEAQLMGKYQRR